MTDFPLPTLAAAVDANGITSPSFADIFSSLQASYRNIFGQDTYLDADTQDGQFLAVAAKAIFDSNQMAIAVFNSYSPTTAQGVALSSIVKLNGLARQVPGDSTVSLTLIGQANTLILNGLVGDNAGLGTQWKLPVSVTIPESGTVDVTATCTTNGAVAAAPGTLTERLTPVPGWQTVTNAASASLGAPVESDANLRRRQARSTAFPAITPRESIEAKILAIPGVTRAQVYENDTGVTDSNGIPGHSIAAVVQGGDNVALATAIARSKSPGTGTYGTINEVIVDSLGVPNSINFDALTLVTFKVLVIVTALQGFVSSTEGTITTAIASYLNALDIGVDSFIFRMTPPAALKGEDTEIATGLAKAQLDALAGTYTIEPGNIAQARPNMTAIAGPYVAGSTIFSMANLENYRIGDIVYPVLDDGSYYRATITAVSLTTITVAPGIPVARQLLTGGLVYVADDVDILFNEAAFTVAADIAVSAP